MEKTSPEQQSTGLSYSRWFSRDDKPLPRHGCSWAFYLLLVALVAFLTFMYIRYQSR